MLTVFWRLWVWLCRLLVHVTGPGGMSRERKVSGTGADGGDRAGREGEARPKEDAPVTSSFSTGGEQGAVHLFVHGGKEGACTGQQVFLLLYGR